MVTQVANLIKGELLTIAVSPVDIARAVPKDYNKRVITQALIRTFPTLGIILWAEWKQSTRIALGFDDDEAYVYTLDSHTNLANFLFDSSGKWLPYVTEAVLRPESSENSSERFLIAYGPRDYRLSSSLKSLAFMRRFSDEGDPVESARVFDGNSFQMNR